MPMKVKQLDPSVIEINQETRVRKGPVDMDHVQRLAESIGQFGQRVPIIVREQGDKTVLEAGEHRLGAVKLYNSLLGPDEEPLKIDAIVVKHDDTAGMIGAIIENALRKETTVFDQGDAMAKLIKAGKKQVEVAQIFGVSEGTVSQRLTLAEAPKKLQKMVEDGDMEADAAIFIAKLPVDDKLRQEVIEESIRHRNTMDEMESKYDAKREEQEAVAQAKAKADEEAAKLKELQAEYKEQCKAAKAEGKEQPKPSKALTEALKKKELSPSQKAAFENVKRSSKADKAKRKTSVEDAKRAAKAKGAAKPDTPTPLSRKQLAVILEALATDEKNPLPESARNLIARIQQRMDDECTDAQLRNSFIKFCYPDAEEVKKAS